MCYDYTTAPFILHRHVAERTLHVRVGTVDINPVMRPCFEHVCVHAKTNVP
jgi:hypothetical protein